MSKGKEKTAEFETEPNLAHLRRLSDDTGLIQHAFYTLPDRSTGYTTDDNARALLVTLEAFRLHGNEVARRLADTYLSFLRWVHNGRGKYRNFLAYDRSFLDEEGSEDCFGRAFWALGAAAGRYPETGGRQAASELFWASFPHVAGLDSLRGRALAARGLLEMANGSAQGAGQARERLRESADGLIASYQATAGRGWHWYENIIAYDNAAIPLSLLLAYETFGCRTYLKIARESLDFLLAGQLGECFQPVGNRGWWVRGGRPAFYDQQPIEAGSTLEACLVAFRLTGKKEYLETARLVGDWFTGKNVAGKSLYDPVTGGCRDGIHPEGMNQNQGAESLLAYLWSRLVMVKEREALGMGGESGGEGGTVS